MFDYIVGTISDKRDGNIIVEAYGIGYEIAVPVSTYAELEVGKTAKIFVYLAVREDGVSLYGWTDMSQKVMFLRLIGISGVGPRLAQSILAGMNASELALCISRGDSGAITKIKGVGKKTGERIVLELRDRISKEYGESDGSFVATTVSTPNSKADEAVLALMSLGFGRNEAQAAVAAVYDETLSPEDIVYKALRGSRH